MIFANLKCILFRFTLPELKSKSLKLCNFAWVRGKCHFYLYTFICYPITLNNLYYVSNYFDVKQSYRLCQHYHTFWESPSIWCPKHNFNMYLKYKTLEPVVFCFIRNISCFGISLVVFLLWLETDLNNKSLEVGLLVKGGWNRIVYICYVFFGIVEVSSFLVR